MNMEISIAESDNIHQLTQGDNTIVPANSNTGGFDWDAIRKAVGAEWGENSSAPSEIKIDSEEKLVSLVKKLACAQALEDHKKEVLQ